MKSQNAGAQNTGAQNTGAKPNGRPPHVPTDKDRAYVRSMASTGTPQADIALVVGIHDETLRLHYRAELDTAAILADAQVKQSLHWMATKGRNVTAAIWWTKTRCGWSEKQSLELSGPGGGPVTFRWADAPAAAAPAGYRDEDRGSA